MFRELADTAKSLEYLSVHVTVKENQRSKLLNTFGYFSHVCLYQSQSALFKQSQHFGLEFNDVESTFLKFTGSSKSKYCYYKSLLTLLLVYQTLNSTGVTLSNSLEISSRIISGPPCGFQTEYLTRAHKQYTLHSLQQQNDLKVVSYEHQNWRQLGISLG